MRFSLMSRAIRSRLRCELIRHSPTNDPSGAMMKESERGRKPPKKADTYASESAPVKKAKKKR